MTDDLVKRLREGDEFERFMLAERAADRIEELEAKLATCEKYRDAYAEMGRIGTEALRDMDAKLAKAMEALDEAWFMLTVPHLNYEPEPEEPGLRCIKTALEELKGEK